MGGIIGTCRARSNSKERFPPRPEIHDHCEHGPGVQHDEEEGLLRVGGVEPHQLLREDYVGRAGHGQQFGSTLDDGEKEDLEDLDVILHWCLRKKTACGIVAIAMPQAGGGSITFSSVSP